MHSNAVENAVEASMHVDLRQEIGIHRKVHWSMNKVTHFSSGPSDPRNCQKYEGEWGQGKSIMHYL